MGAWEIWMKDGDKRPHRCGYKMLGLFGIKSGLRSLKGQSNLRFRYFDCTNVVRAGLELAFSCHLSPFTCHLV